MGFPAVARGAHASSVSRKRAERSLETPGGDDIARGASSVEPGGGGRQGRLMTAIGIGQILHPNHAVAALPGHGSSAELQQLAATFASSQDRAGGALDGGSSPQPPWARGFAGKLGSGLGGSISPSGLLGPDDLGGASEVQLDGILDMLDNWEQFERPPGSLEKGAMVDSQGFS